MSNLTISVAPSRESGLDPVDVVVAAQPTATVADLAKALGAHLAPGRGDCLVVPVDAGGPWPAQRPLAECGLRSGDLLDVATVPPTWLDQDTPVGAVLAEATITAGPDAGRRIALRSASALIGRGATCAIRLNDPVVSAQHARLSLIGPMTLTDEASANGTFVDGVAVTRPTRITWGASITIGATTLVLSAPADAAQRSGEIGPAASDTSVTDPVSVFRAPRLGEPLATDEIEVAAPPRKQQPSPMPWAMLALPIIMGVAVLFSSRGPSALIYMLAWPIIGLGGWWQQKRHAAKEFAKECALWQVDLDEAECRLSDGVQAQQQRLEGDHPDPSALGARISNSDGSLWARHPGDPDFGQVRIGRGVVPAALTGSIKDGGDLEVLRTSRTRLATYATLADAPIAVPLSDLTVVSVVGDDALVDDAIRAIVLRLALDHSPADLAISAVLTPASAHHESWLRWLPHAGNLPGGDPSIAIGAGPAQRLLDNLVGGVARGHVVCVVDGRIPLPRRTFEAAAAQAATHRDDKDVAGGVHFIWLGSDVHTVPAATDLVLDLRSQTVSGAGRAGVRPVATIDRLDLHQVWRAARAITHRVDEAAVLPADTSMPSMVRLPDVVADVRDVDDVDAIARRWANASGLRAQIGAGADGVVTLDLREDGPHGLVAGTTGSGKSELLQSLICSLAVNNSPERINFLLVDYKGGAAFRECADLPHTIGYITDLTPALVHRALTSLGAEITHREHLLGEYGVKDLRQLEREHPQAAPPSLLICVDEFAALTTEVPDFVDGMVNIAQRGRSLGMHVLLATQRPAGVVTPAIRANTDLRIALRVGAEDDSRDVIDSAEAARISRRTPGRAWVRRTGQGAPELVQAAWVGARETIHADRSAVHVEPFSAIAPTRTGPEQGGVHAHTDLDRCVTAIGAAHQRLGGIAPRKPWLPPLPTELLLDAATVCAAAPERGPAQVPIGQLDEPARQAQPDLVLDFATCGHVLVHGASGSGKTEFLRSLAVSASLTDASHPDRPAPFVYGIDFAGGGLAALTALPTVAATLGEQQLTLVLRLIRMLRRTVEQRTAALSATGSATIEDLARQGHPIPRVHVLIDNLPALLEALESGGNLRRVHAEYLSFILQNGRRVGVHLTATAPGRSGIPAALGASFGRRVVLRMTTEDDYMMLGVPGKILIPESPAGSALVGREVAQIATIGGAGTEVLTTRLEQYAERLTDAVADRGGAGVLAMPSRVPSSALPAPTGTTVAIGVTADVVAPHLIDLLAGPVLIAGRAGTGRTSMVRGLHAVVARGDHPPLETIRAHGRQDLGRPDGAADPGVVRDPEVLLQRLRAWLAGSADRDPQDWLLVTVDDAAEWDRGAEHDAARAAVLADLAALMPALPAARVALIVVADPDDARTKVHQVGLVQAARRGRRAILLQPEGMDGSVMQVTVPAQTLEPLAGIGRGLWCADGALEILQAVGDLEEAS